jgi:hypothetical protein
MRIFIVLLLFPLATAIGLAKDTTGTVVILSEKVGPAIDLEERNFYGMFSGVQYFESTVLLQMPDSSYLFKIITKNTVDSSKGVVLFPQTKEALESIRHIIETYNGIEHEAPPIETYNGIEHETPPSPISKKSTISGVRLLGEFLAGIAGEIGGAMIPPLVIPKDVTGEDFEDRIGLALLGAVIGNSFGVYLIGNSGDETGSYYATLLGSALGMVIVPIIGPTFGGMIGFNSTRKNKAHPVSGSAVINFRDGRMSFAFPDIYFCPNTFDGSDLIKNMDLVHINF